MPEISKTSVDAAIRAADQDGDNRVNTNTERMLFNKALGGGVHTNGAYRVLDEKVKQAFDNNGKYREGVTSAELRDFFAGKTEDGGFNADEFMAVVNGKPSVKTNAGQSGAAASTGDTADTAAAPAPVKKLESNFTEAMFTQVLPGGGPLTKEALMQALLSNENLSSEAKSVMNAMAGRGYGPAAGFSKKVFDALGASWAQLYIDKHPEKVPATVLELMEQLVSIVPDGPTLENLKKNGLIKGIPASVPAAPKAETPAAVSPASTPASET